MANFVTVSLECRTEEVRAAFKEAFTNHREFVPKPNRVSGMPDLLVLELDEHNPTRTISEVRAIVHSAAKTEVVLTSKRTDPQIMLEVMRLGVKEFLPQPLQPKDVEEALVRFKTRFAAQNQNANLHLGAVVAVMGGKAGVGTSTVAENLAVALQQNSKANSQTVLVDLNLGTNDLTLYLDLATPQGWHDLSQDISRLDPAMLQGVLAKHSSGVHLLGPGGDGMDDTLAPGCVLYTIDLLRSMFDYVVVDCGARMTAPVEECLELVSQVSLVTNLSVPSVRHSKGIIERIQDRLGVGVPISLVVNRYRTRDAALLKQSEELLRMKAAWLVPNDYELVSGSLDQGTSFLQQSPRAEISQSYTKRAADFAKEWTQKKKGAYGVTSSDKSDSILGRIWTTMTNGVRVKAGLA
ncbi:MAG TPA: hypothetical protein VFS39_19175 [Nitrospira sp.]|nr:hypothetical protein [Nitrospira sp.]